MRGLLIYSSLLQVRLLIHLVFVFGKTEDRLCFLNLEGTDLKLLAYNFGKAVGTTMTSRDLYSEVRPCLLCCEPESRNGFGIKGDDV